MNHEVVECLKLIVKWSHSRFMKINPDKTEILLFYPPSLEKEVLIKGIMFEEQCIRFSDCVKNVGVYLDKHLNFNKHINNITSHCYKILKDIGSIKKSLQKDHLAQLVRVGTQGVRLPPPLWFFPSPPASLTKLLPPLSFSSFMIFLTKKFCHRMNINS